MNITFEELNHLVADIDYLDEESYPVIFRVDGKEYACGIDQKENQVLSEVGISLDKQDPDTMTLSEIESMLKSRCKIIETSFIEIDLDKSFTGQKMEEL